MKDPIVEEVRRMREEHASKFNYDIDAIYADLERLEAESKSPDVSREPRRPIDAPGVRNHPAT